MDIIKLIKEFNSQNILNQGILFIFSDTIGKPGDRILTLSKIELITENELLFNFGKNEIVKISNPSGIKYDNQKIVIQKASKILWNTVNFELIYAVENSEIVTKLLHGEHTFKINKEFPAFEFTSW